MEQWIDLTWVELAVVCAINAALLKCVRMACDYVDHRVALTHIERCASIGSDMSIRKVSPRLFVCRLVTKCGNTPPITCNGSGKSRMDAINAAYTLSAKAINAAIIERIIRGLNQ